MQPLTLSQTELLTKQGAAALQANDKKRAYELLGRAVQLAPHNEQAWLWLSGAVDATAERRYCLERVLVINPHNAAALRGMALLPPALPVSPFPEDVPPAPSSIEPEPGQARAVGVGLAASASAPLVQAASLLDILAQPDPATPAAANSGRGASGVTDPAVVTYMPPPISGAVVPLPAPVVSPERQALADFVVREFGRHRSREEIIRTLSERHHLAWAEAQDLVAKIAHEQRRSIAARQSPFLIFLGIATIIGGCLLVGRGILVLSSLYSHPALTRLLNPRAVVISIGQMGVGVVMVLGALIGLGQTIKGLFK
jgi:hypothetical protein